MNADPKRLGVPNEYGSETLGSLLSKPKQFALFNFPVDIKVTTTQAWHISEYLIITR
jgi:hypothetical protein